MCRVVIDTCSPLNVISKYRQAQPLVTDRQVYTTRSNTSAGLIRHNHVNVAERKRETFQNSRCVTVFGQVWTVSSFPQDLAFVLTVFRQWEGRSKFC